MKISEKNNFIFIAAYALRSAALICSTGTLMQTFLTVMGMSATNVYIHTTTVQAVNVLFTLLFAKFADTKKIAFRTFAVSMAGGILFLCYLPLCIKNAAGPREFILLMAVSIAQAVTSALLIVCEYKLPYYMLKKEEYGYIMAICGILTSGISFAIGAVMTALSVKISYNILMLFAFIIAAVFMCTAGLLSLKFKRITQIEEDKQNIGLLDKNSIKKVFFHPVFYKLFVINLIRGFSAGMTLVFAVIAAENLGYSEQITTAAVAIQSVASLLACALFGILSKYFSARLSILAGSLSFILLPFILIPDKPILFLVFTGIILFGKTLVDYAVPSMLLFIVPAEIAGPYNAYRMILHNGGSLLATSIAAAVSPAVLLPIAAIFQIITGAVFFGLPLIKKASPLKVVR